jgi:hypothetical protein
LGLRWDPKYASCGTLYVWIVERLGLVPACFPKNLLLIWSTTLYLILEYNKLKLPPSFPSLWLQPRRKPFSTM